MLMSDFELHLDQFMLHCDTENLSRKTLRSYEQTLRLFQFYLENECNITKINELKSWHIKKYIAHLSERGKYTVTANDHSKRYNHPDNRIDFGREISDTTIANYLRNIKVFFNYLYESRDITENPVKGIPNIKPQRKRKELLEPIELKRLLGAMDVTKFHEYRLWLCIRLILDTGVRKSR